MKCRFQDDRYVAMNKVQSVATRRDIIRRLDNGRLYVATIAVPGPTEDQHETTCPLQIAFY